MKEIHALINETLENLNGRQIQGLPAINLMNFIIEQLFAIGRAATNVEAMLKDQGIDIHAIEDAVKAAQEEAKAPAEAEQ